MRERLRRDVFLNVALSAVSALATLALVRYAGRAYPAAVLGLFLLSRRFSDSFSNLFQFGTPYALRRFLAQGTTEGSQVRVSLLSVGATAGVGAAAFLLGLLFPSQIDAILFDSTAPQALAAVTIVLTTALALTNIAISILTAHQRYGWANVVNIMNPSGWLLVCFVLPGGARNDVTGLLTRGALLCIAMSLILPAWVWWRAPRRPHATRAISTREFAAFALPRTLAPFAETLLFSTSAWLLRGRPEEAAYLLVAFTVLRSANVALQPVGAVAGVTAVQLQDRALTATVRRGLNLLVGSTLYLGVVMACLGGPWTHLLLRLWLANPSLAAAALLYTTAVLAALPPYIIYQGLKQVIDMLWESPLNLYTSLVGLAVLVAVELLGSRWLEAGPRVLLASVAGLSATGILTLWWLRSYLEPASFFGALPLLAVTGVLGLGNAVVAGSIAGYPPPVEYGVAALSVLASGAILFGILGLARPSPFVTAAAGFILRRPPRDAATPLDPGAP